MALPTDSATKETGEVNRVFPSGGRVYEANFGTLVYHLCFETDEKMTFIYVEGAREGISEDVYITAEEIRPGVYLVFWQEINNTSFVQVLDFENERIYSNITQPDGIFLSLKGRFRELK